MNQAINETVNVINEQLPNSLTSIYLTGSRLYGFNQNSSDFDLKVYVFPTIEDIALNRMISKEVKINGVYVEKVDVKDFRYQYKELSKPNFGSLHLLQSPMIGEQTFTRSTIESSIELGKKNLILSMLGTFKSRQEVEGNKEAAHLSFLFETADYFWNNQVKFDYFSSSVSNGIARKCMEYREGKVMDRQKWIDYSNSLFDEVVKSKRNEKNNEANLLLSELVDQISLPKKDQKGE